VKRSPWAPAAREGLVFARAEQAEVKIARPLEANLFAHGEHGVDRPVRDFLLMQLMQHFADDRASGFVVAAEHGAAVGADDVAFDYGLYAFARNDSVHVRTQKERRHTLAGGIEMADQIATVAVDLLGGVIEAAAQARAFQFAHEPQSGGRFPPR
jgi:hypothetical protein